MRNTIESVQISEKINTWEKSSGLQMLIHNLIKHSPKLAEKIVLIDRALREDFSHIDPKCWDLAKRILDNYESSIFGQGYFAPDLVIQNQQKRWINEVNNRPFACFKKYIELEAKSIIVQWIQEEYRNNGITDVNIRSFLASDYDDLFSATDYIVTENNGNIYAIDLAITKQAGYLSRKMEMKYTSPKEFLISRDMDQNLQIPRYVFAISPSIMAEFIEQIVIFLETGYFSPRYQKKNEYISSRLDLVKRIYRDKTRNWRTLTPQNIGNMVEHIREKLGILTNLVVSEQLLLA